MLRKFSIFDVFSDVALAGNQLGVVFDSEGLDGPSMQKIAREFNFAETIFLSPPQNADYTSAVRIFTPRNELPFAGHPTVGAAVAITLAQGKSGDHAVVLEEQVGPVACQVRIAADHAPFASFELPVIAQETQAISTDHDIAKALSLSLDDIGFDNHLPANFHGGLPYTLVPVKDLETVGRVILDMAHWRNAFGAGSHSSAYVYCRETAREGNHFHARMFAPDAGIPEDPATGSAVASMVGAIVKFENLDDGEHVFNIEQGFEMGRPSLIELTLTIQGKAAVAGRIGGFAVEFASGTIHA